MKELNPGDFPRNLTEEDINLLANLMINNPISDVWKEIAAKLTPEQKVRINKRAENKNYSKTKELSFFKKGSMDDNTWNELKKRKERAKFYGNMGEPATPSEFKSKYGEWPPGYDENGNKLQ